MTGFRNVMTGLAGVPFVPVNYRLADDRLRLERDAQDVGHVVDEVNRLVWGPVDATLCPLLRALGPLLPAPDILLRVDEETRPATVTVRVDAGVLPPLRLVAELLNSSFVLGDEPGFASASSPPLTGSEVATTG